MNHTEAVETKATERYLLDEMTPNERSAFEEHFFDCAECADDIRLGSMMADGARAGLAKNSGTARPLTVAAARRPSLALKALPWALAATFALAFGYQSIAHRPFGAHDDVPIALVPATLRPATRGTETVVRPGPDGAISLVLDVEDSRFEHGVHYQLRHSNGAVVAAGDAPAPEGGAPFLLYIPGTAVHAQERYVIDLRDSQSTAPPAVEYRFTVGPV